MKSRTLGIGLIIIGIVMIAYTGFNLFAMQNVTDVGQMHMSTGMGTSMGTGMGNNYSFQWLPIIGALILISGAVVVYTSGRAART
jgi:hypothetical protein